MNSLIWYDCVNGWSIVLPTNALSFSSKGMNKTGVSPFVGVLPISSVKGHGWCHADLTVTGTFTDTQRSPLILSFFKRAFSLYLDNNTIAGNVDSMKGFTFPGLVLTDTPCSMCLSFVYTDDSIYTANASAVYLDGVAGTQNGAVDSWGATTTNNKGMIGNLYRYTDSYSFTGTYHAIRLYKRPLTVAEMQQNTAIDKERFNLP